MTVEVSTIVLMRGLPGSGKSYIASNIQDLLGDARVVILDPDLVDTSSEEYIAFCNELAEQQIDQKLYPYRFLRSKGYNAIEEGKIAIWNQAFTNQELVHRTILHLQTYAKDHGISIPSALVVDVVVPEQIAIERVADRSSRGGHDVSEEEFKRFLNDYRVFDGYDYPTIQIDGTQGVDASVRLIVDQIQKLSF